MAKLPKTPGYNGLLKMLALSFGALFVICIGLILVQDKHHSSGDGPPKYAETPLQQHWSFDGYFGTFDRQSVQRGFQVYREVCSACHGLRRVAFRNLADIGFSEGEIKAIAAEYTYEAINGEGETVERAGIPADKLPSPFANELAGRAANNGAWPPDMSLLAKSRPNGANYIHSLITGYEETPEGYNLGNGQYYNPYFEGRKISMAPPLMDGQVTYADGTEATEDQMATDIVSFLQWAAEPEMEMRKRMGIKVMLFLLLFTVFFYIAKRRIWARVK